MTHCNIICLHHFRSPLLYPLFGRASTLNAWNVLENGRQQKDAAPVGAAPGGAITIFAISLQRRVALVAGEIYRAGARLLLHSSNTDYPCPSCKILGNYDVL